MWWCPRNVRIARRTKVSRLETPSRVTVSLIDCVVVVVVVGARDHTLDHVVGEWIFFVFGVVRHKSVCKLMFLNAGLRDITI